MPPLGPLLNDFPCKYIPSGPVRYAIESVWHASNSHKPSLRRMHDFVTEFVCRINDITSCFSLIGQFLWVNNIGPKKLFFLIKPNQICTMRFSFHTRSDRDDDATPAAEVVDLEGDVRTAFSNMCSLFSVKIV